MKKLICIVIASFIMLFSLVGCGGEVEVGYSPPIAIPIRVAMNSHGNLSVDFSGQWVTPIGTFDIESNADIYSIQSRYDNNVLIIRVDEEAVVYELQSGKEFRVDFDDDNTLYKRVALKYKTNGDIILELESVREISEAVPDSGNSTTSSSKNYVTISCAQDITQAALRKSPGYSSKDDSVDIIYKINCGQQLLLLGDSQRADGLTWWKVSWSGYVGWMADHTGSGRTILVFN